MSKKALNVKGRRIKLVSMLSAILLIVSIIIPAAAFANAPVSKSIQQCADACNVFEVEVDFIAEQVEPKIHDIIIILDNSLSMTMNLEPGAPTKKTITVANLKALKDKILAANSDNRIAIASFSGMKGTVADDSVIHTGFTNDNATLNQAIQSYAGAGTQGTNIDAGLNRGIELLTNDTSRPSAEKRVFLFTDGALNRAIGLSEALHSSANMDYLARKAAEEAPGAKRYLLQTIESIEALQALLPNGRDDFYGFGMFASSGSSLDSMKLAEGFMVENINHDNLVIMGDNTSEAAIQAIFDGFAEAMVADTALYKEVFPASVLDNFTVTETMVNGNAVSAPLAGNLLEKQVMLDSNNQAVFTYKLVPKAGAVPGAYQLNGSSFTYGNSVYDSNAVAFTLNEALTVSINGGATAERGDSITLLAEAQHAQGALSYTWTVNGVATAGAESLTIDTGSFAEDVMTLSVTLEATDGYCTATTVHTVTITNKTIPTPTPTTPVETPTTPVETPTTPVETPTTPVETPTTPVETPTTPVETPTTPVETPTTPVETPTTPVETPTTPVETPTTPVETPTTPVETPTTPVETPTTPVETPVTTPVQTPEVTPSVTPEQTPNATSEPSTSPPPSEEIEIIDEDVPLDGDTGIDTEEDSIDEEIIIVDEEVPLSVLPKTGEATSIPWYAAGLVIAGLGVTMRLRLNRKLK